MVPKAGDLIFVDTISSHDIHFLMTNNVSDFASFSGIDVVTVADMVAAE